VAFAADDHRGHRDDALGVQRAGKHEPTLLDRMKG
jgi:hypothetical protein